MQQLQFLRLNFVSQITYTREIRARPVQAFNRSNTNWVSARVKNDRDYGRGIPCRNNRSCSPTGNDDLYLLSDEF
jgi:hypothetical protein